jgi:GNAT superfamily N-acetyltransferase
MISALGGFMLSIRQATLKDAGLVLTLIRELADYEHGLEHVSNTEAGLARDGFGPHRKFRAIIAEWDEHPAGYALFFDSYSTWRGPGIFLEDLFVRNEFRAKGIGKALLAYVADVAVKENCYGVRWEVLDWNQLAIDFYKTIGAEFKTEWRLVVLTKDPLRRLSSEVTKIEL